MVRRCRSRDGSRLITRWTRVLLLLARLQASGGQFDPAIGTSTTSSAGAVGPMQVKPDTFAGIARLHPFLGSTDVTDPTRNVTAGATLFAHLLRKYRDVSLAILAYHDGETRIDRMPTGAGAVSPSQDALDQARRVTAGYDATGSRADGPSAPPAPDLTVPPIPPWTLATAVGASLGDMPANWPRKLWIECIGGAPGAGRGTGRGRVGTVAQRCDHRRRIPVTPSPRHP